MTKNLQWRVKSTELKFTLQNLEIVKQTLVCCLATTKELFLNVYIIVMKSNSLICDLCRGLGLCDNHDVVYEMPKNMYIFIQNTGICIVIAVTDIPLFVGDKLRLLSHVSHGSLQDCSFQLSEANNFPDNHPHCAGTREGMPHTEMVVLRATYIV